MERQTAGAVGAFLAVVALLGGGAPVRAAEPMTLEQVAELRRVDNAVISPDGSQVAYLLGVPRKPFVDEDGPGWRELHLLDDQGKSRPFITGETRVGGVTWTADSEHVAFLSKRGEEETKGLYMISVRGGEARHRLDFDGDIEQFSLSPDGARVVAVVSPKEPKERTELVEKGFDAKIFEEDELPAELWVAPLDGSEPRRVELEGHPLEAHFSPDGKRLAVAIARSPLVDDTLVEVRLKVLDSATGEVLAKVDNPGKLGAVAWSPDGQRLAMITAADRNDPREGRLAVAAAVGGAVRDLMPNLEAHVDSFAWRDGSRLSFIAHQGTGSFLGEVDLQGKIQRAPRTKSAVQPLWSDLSLAKDGSAALVGASAMHPGELYTRAAASGILQKQTESNPWLAETRLASQEAIRFKARDGLELEGVLVRPLDVEPGSRSPLVVVVHGGPEAHYSNGWLTDYGHPAQVLAGRGFAVFYPNYRGSTGRGVAFSKLGQGDPAGKEFDDLVDGVDHLVATGLVDRDRVGITGGSYGGYASAWGATYYSERYAAAVMFVGLSNNLSMFGTSDIPNELHRVHLRTWPWDDWKLYLERSPIYYAKKARTPILILHGEDDPRVFRGQSMELYRYLKVLGQTPVRLVLYPKEEHGNRKAAARYDYSLRLVRWMEHYLKGPGGEPPPSALSYPLAPDDEDEG